MITEQTIAKPSMNGQTAEPDLAAQPNVHMASDAYLAMDMLRFTTAGSVDDGKSTLIGRLLYDSKAIFEDQLEAVERASRQRGDTYVDLALLTDGLRANENRALRLMSPIAILRRPNANLSLPTPRSYSIYAQHGHRRLHRRVGHHFD
ncbi:MAG: hypothetical protein R3E79_42460 [Caldilineaceae bacterium]